MLWKYTAGQVLTMEYAPGVKINRIEELQRMGVDRKELARRTVECYLQQLLTYGFFHAGNFCCRLPVTSLLFCQRSFEHHVMLQDIPVIAVLRKRCYASLGLSKYWLRRPGSWQ